MTNVPNFATLFSSMPNGFPVDKEAGMKVWKTWASVNERFPGIVRNMATRSNEVATASAQETFAQLRDLTTGLKEPKEFAQALTTFTQAQMDRTRRSAEAFGTILKESQAEAVELFTKATVTTADETKATAQAAF